MKDGWRGEEGREESKKGAGVDMKCEALPSGISECVLESGASPPISDFTGQ